MDDGVDQKNNPKSAICIKSGHEKKAWLHGFRFSLLLVCCLVNIVLLVGVVLIREEGCVICLTTTPENIPPVAVPKNIFADTAREKLLSLKNAPDETLISSLISEEKVGFGYTEGDIAASFLYARGFDFEPVLKAHSAWPMPVFLFSSQDQENKSDVVADFPLLSGLTLPIRISLQEYFTSKKAPYRLEYVLERSSQNEDLTFAEEALSHRSDVRLWLSIYQLSHLSKEEAWKALLAMKKEAIVQAPSDKMSVEELCFLFEKKIPSFLAKALVEHRLESCLLLEDQLIEKLLESLQDFPKTRARLCIKLLQVPRKEAIHQQVKKIVTDLAQDPKLEAMTVPELIAYFKAPKVALATQSPTVPSSTPQKVAKPPVVGANVTEAKHPPSAQPTCIIHTVQKGDSLWKIAKKYKVDPNKIAALNGVKKGQLDIGQKLRIPAP